MVNNVAVSGSNCSCIFEIRVKLNKSNEYLFINYFRHAPIRNRRDTKSAHIPPARWSPSPRSTVTAAHVYPGSTGTKGHPCGRTI